MRTAELGGSTGRTTNNDSHGDENSNTQTPEAGNNYLRNSKILVIPLRRSHPPRSEVVL